LMLRGACPLFRPLLGETPFFHLDFLWSDRSSLSLLSFLLLITGRKQENDPVFHILNNIRNNENEKRE